eukprot:COSAG06_NODE_9737_length_1829_cov_1.556069_2_plen_169_part_00
MGRKKEHRASGSVATGPWLSVGTPAVAAAVVAVAVAVAAASWAFVSAGGGNSPGHGRAGKASAAAEWQSFRDLVLQKQRSRVSLSDEAVGHLDACLEMDPDQPECAFWRARDLMQRGSNENTLRARDLLAGIDVNAVSTADPVDVLYLYATAAGVCSLRETSFITLQL